MEKAQITAWQFFLDIRLFSRYFIFFHPGGLIVAAKQDAWIVPLWAGVPKCIVSLLDEARVIRD